MGDFRGHQTLPVDVFRLSIGDRVHIILSKLGSNRKIQAEEMFYPLEPDPLARPRAFPTSRIPLCCLPAPEKAKQNIKNIGTYCSYIYTLVSLLACILQTFQNVFEGDFVKRKIC